MGTARAADHDYLRDLGIEEPIDYRTTDFTAVVREADLVRGENTDRSRWVLSAGGRVLAAEGPRTPPDARADALHADVLHAVRG